ncbi:MAG: primosomal protein N', partial [Flavobacteriales bacterium]|nr:primosomal protein N' [Flavobacteriales bacterium]
MGIERLEYDKDETSEQEVFAHFVEVIVSLHVPGSFTYRVPSQLVEEIKIGQQVLVQFGRRKVYAAVVCAKHHKAPETHTAKYILEILQPEPIVTHLQLKLWDWISKYYMCYHGDVMNAALPGGFRLSSETMITRFEALPTLELNTREHLLLSTFDTRSQLSMDDISEMLGSNSAAYNTVNQLIAKKAIALHEVVKEKVNPRYETYIMLNPFYEEEKEMSQLFNGLEQRAKVQT